MVLSSLALTLVACWTDPSPPPPRREPVPIPRPNLAGAEAPVAARIDEAVAKVREGPGLATRWGSLGIDLHAHGFLTEAIACYKQAAALDRSDYRWPYLAGLTLRASDPAEALEWLERAASLEPPSPAFHVSYGWSLFDAADMPAARERFTKALSIKAGFAYALLGLGRVELAEGRPEEAVKHLEEAAAVAPWIHEVHELRSRAFEQLGDRARAEIAALSARAYPDSLVMPDPVMDQVRSRGVGSREWSERGLRLERQGRLGEAEAAFRKALEQRPGGSGDRKSLGRILTRQGKLDEAVDAFESALETAPEDPVAHDGLARALIRKGDLERAERHLRAALQADAVHAGALYNLALVRQRQGRAAEAESLLRKALDANPAHREALTSLGSVLAAAGNEAAAIEVWRRAVAIDPLNVDARYDIALTLAHGGDHAGAVEELRAALARDPGRTAVQRLLAWELATAPDDAVRDGRRALEIASTIHADQPEDPRAADILAAALAETGQWDRAVGTAERAESLARQSGEEALADQILTRLEGYRAGRPHRQPARGDSTSPAN